jgi:hypothetical protein
MSTAPIVRVQTPSFGVCGSSLTTRCVLTEESCGESELYSAPYETDKIPGLYSCNDPKEVEVGRCTSPLDNVRCVPSEVSCGEEAPFYNKIDATCSLVADKIAQGISTDQTVEEQSDSPFDTHNDNHDDDGTGSETTPERTTFPACANLDDGKWQCVLDESSCRNNERLTYAKWAEDFGPHPCRCEDVPTGVCYETSAAEGKLTTKNSFCAVSVRDCPATHKFMNDREFLASEQATYDCRLCENGDGVPSFAAGGCLESGASQTDSEFRASSFEYCALESTDCSSGVDGFVSAKRLEQQGLFCPIERTTNWGICSDADGSIECTNKESSCLYSFTYLDTRERECDINLDSKTGIPTYFSSCNPKTAVDRLTTDNVRCVWDEWECDPNEENWEEARFPNDDLFTGCTCENVFTGVCREPTTGEYHCAVSPEGCTAPDRYVSQRNLKDQGIDLECQMCAPKDPSPPQVSPPTMPPVDPTPPPITPLVPSPTDQPVMVVGPPTFNPTDQTRPTLPPALNVGGMSPTMAPNPWPTVSTVDGPGPTYYPTRPPFPLPTYSPIAPTNAPEQQFDSESLPANALILIAVGPVVVIAFIVLIYAMFTGGGTLKSKGNTRGIEPNHNQDMVLPTATLT